MRSKERNPPGFGACERPARQLTARGRAAIQWVMRITLLLLCLVKCSGAWAGVCSLVVPAESWQIPVSGTIAAPRDSAPGKVLATFSYSHAAVAGQVASCGAGTFQQGWGMLTTPHGAADSNGVFPTNVAGIGVLITTAGGAKIPVSQTLTGPYGLYDTGYPSVSLVYKIVVTGPVSAGTITAADLPSVHYYYDSVTWFPLTPTGSMTVTVSSCQTPDVTVSLGPHRLSEMTGPGTFTSATGFSAGMNSIRYEIDAVTTVLAGTGNSVVTLDSGSSATGIGLQLLDGNGNPLALGTKVPFSGSYSSSTGGSYTIPLKARYYQTGPTTGAGTANTEMAFLMTYQ